MASTLSSRNFQMIFFFLPVFVVVSIVIRLTVMSYRLSMKEIYPSGPTEGQLSVFIGFRRKLLDLMAVKTLKVIFRQIFNIKQS